MPSTTTTSTDVPSLLTTPSDFSADAFLRNGYSTEQVQAIAASKFLRPTRDVVKHYTMEVTRAVRDDDLEALKDLYYSSGAVLDCCNKFGNSLVHIASRRGHTRIVKFLVEEVQASVHFVDEYGRTPLHDACWTSEPNFEIVEILLRVAPEQVLCRDKRGFTPFEYARQSHVEEWMGFLYENQSLLRLSESPTSSATATTSQTRQ